MVGFTINPVQFFCLLNQKQLKTKNVWIRSTEEKNKKNIQKLQLAQHTTPIAKTHRTATLLASEPIENLKMFISIHHRNITISSRSPQQHHPSLRHHSITDTEQRHHQHKTKASPTYHQNITTQSLHYTSPRHARDITDTSFKDHQKITSTCRKHLDTSPKNHWNISEISPNHPWNTNKT